MHNQSFEETVLVQMLKYIISKHPKADIYNVLKTMYMADRIHLLEYGELMTADTYVKMQYGPVASLCFDILKFVRGESFPYIDDKIREEIKINPDSIFENLSEPDIKYLSKANMKCIDKSIEQYCNYSFNELKKLTHDAIYDSVDFYQEITAFHMAKFLDETGKLTEYLHENSI
jgi:uncharacterized phage-associated protein